MGLLRKLTSIGTMGLVDFRSDKERTAAYTRSTARQARAQTRLLRRQAKQPPAAPAPSIPFRPPVPHGMPAAQWNGTVWQAWNPQDNRWMVWNGQGWQ